jgi:anti-sigma factor RsiW
VNCAQYQEKIPSFLEDLLSEAERRSFRAHLFDCERCSSYALNPTNLAADLRRLNTLPPDFDLEKTVMEAFEASKKKKHRLSKMAWFLIIELAVFLLMFWIFVNRQAVQEAVELLPQKIASFSARPAPSPAHSKEEARAYLKRLEIIQETLRGKTKKS